MTGPALLAIDQGTTSTRSIVFGADGRARGSAQRDLPQIFPRPGWVEHDPEEIWRATVATLRGALAAAGARPADIAGIGITNQRETTILWDRATGRPIHNAIVWQDRRTAAWCARMRDEIGDETLGARTGLLFDAYFSASKIVWLLDHVDGARAAAAAGRLAFGTVDSFLLWHLTGGRVHATDATNAARTMIFDIARQDWDDALLREFGIPRALLPEVRDCAGDFGRTTPELLGAPIAITGIAGDQQAAAIGQACFRPGMIKSTYGTGCFVLVNTGDTMPRSRHRLLATVAARIGGRTTYALEGSIFVSGAAVQWLRDALRIIGAAPETEALARGLAGNDGVYMVPAFVGLGAPWWDPEARGAIFGLTRDTGIAHIARAALEACVYQTEDLLSAMRADGVGAIEAIRIDGGMAVNDWFAQFLADQLGLPVERPVVTETTALGAACLAGLGSGVYASTDEIAARWARDRRFVPADDDAGRAARAAGWRDAVARTRSPAGRSGGD
jgi:glycerol kinase